MTTETRELFGQRHPVRDIFSPSRTRFRKAEAGTSARYVKYCTAFPMQYGNKSQAKWAIHSQLMEF